jgi:hypothetical protein
MDMMAVEKHNEHFQQVISHFGQVNFITLRMFQLFMINSPDVGINLFFLN